MLKKDILRRKDDFTYIYKKGRSVGERYVVLFYKKNNLSYNRIAFLASKKVGNSVERNRARRLMKENYRLLKDDIKSGYDLIFIARNTINDKKAHGNAAVAYTIAFNYLNINIEEGIEILTGVPAGKKDKNGNFPAGTVNHLVYEKLKKYAKISAKD